MLEKALVITMQSTNLYPVTGATLSNGVKFTNATSKLGIFHAVVDKPGKHDDDHISDDYDRGETSSYVKTVEISCVQMLAILPNFRIVAARI